MNIWYQELVLKFQFNSSLKMWLEFQELHFSRELFWRHPLPSPGCCPTFRWAPSLRSTPEADINLAPECRQPSPSCKINEPSIADLKWNRRRRRRKPVMSFGQFAGNFRSGGHHSSGDIHYYTKLSNCGVQTDDLCHLLFPLFGAQVFGPGPSALWESASVPGWEWAILEGREGLLLVVKGGHRNNWKSFT